MPYVTVPKDVTKVKTKVLFNLTKRQLICFGGGLLIGVPLFFLTRNSLGNTMSTLLMIFSMVPAFLLAMYEKNGQHLEVILRNMVRSVFLRPKKRLYKTNNFYAVIERQNNLDKEVYSIVHKEKTVDRGKKRLYRPLSQGRKERIRKKSPPKTAFLICVCAPMASAG